MIINVQKFKRQNNIVKNHRVLLIIIETYFDSFIRNYPEYGNHLKSDGSLSRYFKLPTYFLCIFVPPPSIVTIISIALVVGSVLCTPEKFQNVNYNASGEWVVVFASAVFQVRILFMVDHLVSG